MVKAPDSEELTQCLTLSNPLRRSSSTEKSIFFNNFPSACALRWTDLYIMTVRHALTAREKPYRFFVSLKLKR